MTEIKSLTGKWKGEFTLGPEYEESEGESVNFEMILEDVNGTIHGTTTDTETKDLFSELVTVRGFWDTEMISFVIHYPYSYYRDKQGQNIVDKTQKNHEVSYTGRYNHLLKRFEGDFEIMMETIPLSNGSYLESNLTGSWTMQRADD